MSSHAERYDDLAFEFTAYRQTREKDVQYLLDQRDALLAENQRLRDVAEAVLNDEGASSLLQAIAREALAGDGE